MQCIVSIVVWVVQQMSPLRQILDTSDAPEFRDGYLGLKLNLLNWTEGFEYLKLKRWASTLPLVHKFPWSGFVNFWKLIPPQQQFVNKYPLSSLCSSIIKCNFIKIFTMSCNMGILYCNTVYQG